MHLMSFPSLGYYIVYRSKLYNTGILHGIRDGIRDGILTTDKAGRCLMITAAVPGVMLFCSLFER